MALGNQPGLTTSPAAPIIAGMEHTNYPEMRREEAADVSWLADRNTLAEDYMTAWLYRKPTLVEDDPKPATVASLVSEELCDVADNQLHEMMALIRDMALVGNKRALDLIEAMAFKHANRVCERRSFE